MFSQPVAEIIRTRVSVRTYREAPIGPEAERRLNEFIAGLPPGPFGTKPRLMLLTARAGDEAALKGLGTYGMIRHPAGFVVGAVEGGGRGLEDFGYLMEAIILRATDLGLGTCWLGGTFRKSRFAAAIGAGEGESVPAVVSIGIPVEKRSFRESLIRRVAGSDTRLPWDRVFFSGSFAEPLTAEAAGSYAVPLEMVRLAPSASNKQPWRVVKASGRPVFHFFLRASKGFDRGEDRIARPADLQRVDIGIAMCHFELTAEEMKLPGAWETADPGSPSLPATMKYIATWRGRGGPAIPRPGTGGD